MTVLQVPTSVHHYTALAADAKPTGVPVGSILFTYDDGVTYTCYDGTNWAVSNNTAVT